MGCEKKEAAPAGGGSYPTAPAVKNDTPERKIYLRAEFKALVMVKTQDEVLKAVGRPDRTGEPTGEHWWHYYQTTKDPLTEKIDDDTLVIFKKGQVASLIY